MSDYLKQRERERKLEKIRGKVQPRNDNGPKTVAGKPYTRDEMIAAMGGIDVETGSLDRINAMTLTEALAGVARGEHWPPEDDPQWGEPYEFGADKTTTWITSGEAPFNWAELRKWVKREGATTGWAKANLRKLAQQQRLD